MKQCSVIAFLAGAVIGAAAAILLAPDSGRNTRRRIREMAQDEYDYLKKKMEKEHCDCNAPDCDCNAPDCDCETAK
jgi:Gas vesicle protein